MSDDPFTSVQWDRDENQLINHVDPIMEENLSSRCNTPPIEESTLKEEGVVALSSNLKQTSPQPPPERETEPELETIKSSKGAEPETGSISDEIAADISDSPSKSTTIHKSSNSEVGPPDAASNQKSISSPVPDSQKENEDFSDLHRMEENFVKYKLRLEVSTPISDKDPNGKLFMSYLIVTETNHPDVIKLLQNQKKEEAAESTKETEPPLFVMKVRRRYRDFRFLSACLTNDFPQLLVPPLPPKLNFKYLTGDTFSKAFVHKRLVSLARFVNFICEHKILSQLAVFHYFLSDSSEWSTFTKNLKISKSGNFGSADDASANAAGGTANAEPLLVGKVVNEELLTETVMNFFTSSKHKRETNKDILEISDKLKKLYENLVKLDKIFTRLNKKNSDLKTDYEQFLVQVSRLAAVQVSTTRANDNGNMDPNASFITGASFDGSSAYAANCKVFSESLLFFSERWSQLHQYIDEAFLVSLKDCAKYIIKFSDLIELQHNKKIDLQVLQDYLVKARGELAALGGTTASLQSQYGPSPALIGNSRNSGIVNNTTQLIKDTLSTSATAHIGSSQSDSKKHKLEQKILNLEAEISSQTKVVNAVTNQIINEEYPNWDRYNKKQLKQSMMELCDEEISFYKDLLENWKTAELKLVERLDDLS